MIRRRHVVACITALALGAALFGCNAYDANLLNALRGGRDAGGMLEPYVELCGNGVVDADEACDTQIAAGQEGACPTDCPSEDPCRVFQKAGDKCQMECVELQITRAISGDGCCPEGVGPDQDSDCGKCGDKIISPGETCDPPEKCPTAAACTARNPCLMTVFSGTPESCTASCRVLEIMLCQGGDACCPAGCSAQSDSDCSATCANHVLESGAGETCEVDDPVAPCPDDCDDGIACTTDVMTGSSSNCNVVCSHLPVETAVNGDGCCPPGENQVNDSDCTPVCGNAVVESGEQCDPCPSGCDDENACTADSGSGSTALCTLACTHTPISARVAGDGCCPSGANANNDSDCSPVCGNNVREGTEKCDPCTGCNDGNPCTADSSSGSAGACSQTCTHTAITAPSSGDGCCPSGANASNDSDCTPSCGNGVTESGESCDGQAYCNSSCVTVINSSLVHRYRFNGTGTTVIDSSGGASGQVVGASLSGSGTVVLTGGTSGPYVDLPNGIISSLTNATVEVWLTWAGGVGWQRAFDFGNNTSGEGNQGMAATTTWFLTPSSTNAGRARMVINFTATADDYTKDFTIDHTAALTASVRHQMVGVFDDTNDALRFYIDGSLVGSQTAVTGHLSNIDDRNVWIGRSNYNDAELGATVHEFRIYSSALSTAQISASYNAGPDP